MIPKGRLIIIGGKEDKDGSDPEMKSKNNNFSPKEILKLLVKSKDDRIEVITTATFDPGDMRETYTKTFKEIGYSNFDFLDICDDQIHADYHFKRIKEAKTIFFTGGDQEKICKTLEQSVITDLLKEKYRNEGDFTIAGTSAGAMCIPKIVIVEAINGEAILEHDIEFDTGLGFLENCIIDTHFIHRARFGRLVHAVLLNRECWGIGLGEDTALVIEDGYNATCRGSGMVWLVDAENIGQTNVDSVEKGFPVYAENLKVHILTDHCKIDLSKDIFLGTETGKD